MEDKERKQLVAIAIVLGMLAIGMAVVASWSDIQNLILDPVAQKKTIKTYNSIHPIKYSGDTIEFEFTNRKTKRKFEREWRKYNCGLDIEYFKDGDNMQILKYSGDTVQLRFKDSRTQLQFERAWRKYSNYKLPRNSTKTL
ncbi:MAG: hypothetical protein II453_13560 [Alphaproteobacteria bacterium]|nr:hypothetical protein [Alphaproteobacteria bacterium]